MVKLFYHVTWLIGLASADLVVYCENNKDSNLRRTGGFTEYMQCGGDICTCYAYELLCLIRSADGADDDDKGGIYLESVSYDYAQ